MLGNVPYGDVNQDKEGVIAIDKYTNEFFNTVKRKQDEMMEVYENHKEEIKKKDKLFKIESQILMTRL